ncbi:hypothetical protein POSPLADRAFT_1130124 [Postia placenta MAD-698-R-SB12]|uniref:Uncharacterized protein n=1 Tax=Postia placenta MAD-698-R-SB12 TaxID=670580 RepID=A0A1X6NFY7_9APHY|nr:hypothetical protein POSPLADRAFT_1130124 [Postia placenta MAD-698-R-SB12]OSX67551.1 hypothetical protein POSPLADRAFT_1130124 [Postia placenta MAD-698-R-SB12]
MPEESLTISLEDLIDQAPESPETENTPGQESATENATQIIAAPVQAEESADPPVPEEHSTFRDCEDYLEWRPRGRWAPPTVARPIPKPKPGKKKDDDKDKDKDKKKRKDDKDKDKGKGKTQAGRG